MLVKKIVIRKKKILLFLIQLEVQFHISIFNECFILERRIFHISIIKVSELSKSYIKP